MSLMGWSNSAIAARYQHITTAIRHDIAKQVGGARWPDLASPVLHDKWRDPLF